jgi:uncharacterized protein
LGFRPVTTLAGMLSLQQLFGKDDQCFDLLEASAAQARQSAQALSNLLSHPQPAPSLDGFVALRRAQKQLTQEISQHVVRNFVMALEPEDVEALSHTLYKIPKTIEKFAERYQICALYVQGVDFSRQVALLEKAASQLEAMVRHLRRNSPLEQVKQENQKLQELEGEAEGLSVGFLGDLYSGRHDVQKVIALKELHELLERVIERCREAGNGVLHIILKHA